MEVNYVVALFVLFIVGSVAAAFYLLLTICWPAEPKHESEEGVPLITFMEPTLTGSD